MDFTNQTQPDEVQVPLRPPNQVQPNTPAPQAAQPTAPQATQANPQTAAPATAQPTAFRKGLFDRVLEGMAGGPSRVYDPKTGQESEVPMTKKSITSHILAAAITGIISGAKAAGQAPMGPAGTRTPQNMAALGAGFEGAQQKSADIRNAPQQQLDQQMIRKAAAIKNTTQELANQMAADKLHEDDWSRKESYYQGNRDVYQPILNDIEASDKELAPNQPSLFAARNLSSADTMKQMTGHQGEFSPIQDGWTTEVHDDGRTYHLPTFALVRNGNVNVSRDTLLALSPFDQGVKDVLDKSTADTVPLPATLLIGLQKSATAAHGAYEFVHQMQEGLSVDADKQLSQSVFNDKFRTNPALKQQVTALMSTLGNLGTQSTAHALAQLQASGKAGEIFKLIGKSPNEIQDFIDDKQNEALEAAAKAKKGPIVIDSENKAREILSDPKSTPQQKTQAQTFLKTGVIQEANKAAAKAAVEVNKAESKQDEKDKRTMVYAEDQNGQLVYTTKYDAENNLKATPSAIREVKPSDVKADTQALRQLNDVQLNTSRYTKAANDYAQGELTFQGKPVSEQNPVPDTTLGIQTGSITSSDDLRKRDNAHLHTLMNKAGIADINASISAGGHLEVPVLTSFGERLSRGINSKDYNELSDQAKALYDGYVRTMAAIPAYQKALTGIGRSNKEMLDLELANIANPTMAPSDIVRKQGQFQENLDRAGEGFPKLPGVKTPKQVRQEMEGQQSITQQPSQPQGQVTHILHNGKVVLIPQGVTHILDPKTGKVIEIPSMMRPASRQ